MTGLYLKKEPAKEVLPWNFLNPNSKNKRIKITPTPMIDLITNSTGNLELSNLDEAVVRD